MKLNQVIFSTLPTVVCTLCLISFTSCSKENELSPEEKIIGFWVGDVSQEGLGTLEITLDISSAELNQISGDWTTKDKNISNCDSNIFDCSPFSCSGGMVYKGYSNETLTFSLTLSSGPCFVNSISEIVFLDDNTIRYSNAEQGSNAFVSGTFNRR